MSWMMTSDALALTTCGACLPLGDREWCHLWLLSAEPDSDDRDLRHAEAAGSFGAGDRVQCRAGEGLSAEVRELRPLREAILERRRLRCRGPSWVPRGG